MKKSKTNRKGDIAKVHRYDQCQTPGYALDPILPYVQKDWFLWESACGEGNIVRKLNREGYHNVFGTDLLKGYNFFTWHALKEYNCQITNPPYSVKYDWLKHSCEIDRPFALLMPTDVLAARKGNLLIEEFDIEILVMNPRVNFKMPNMGYDGSGAHYSTSWFTRGLGIGRRLSFVQITHYPDEQMIINIDRLLENAGKQRQMELF